MAQFFDRIQEWNTKPAKNTLKSKPVFICRKKVLLTQ